MLILFDHGAPDKNIRYQQDLAGHTIAIEILGNSRWPIVKLYVDRVLPAGVPQSQAASRKLKFRIDEMRGAPPIQVRCRKPVPSSKRDYALLLSKKERDRP